jgi:hypothetical protein
MTSNTIGGAMAPWTVGLVGTADRAWAAWPCRRVAVIGFGMATTGLYCFSRTGTQIRAVISCG